MKFYALHQSDCIQYVFYFISGLVRILLFAINQITRDSLQKDRKSHATEMLRQMKELYCAIDEFFM